MTGLMKRFIDDDFGFLEPFDVLFKNFFDSEDFFTPLAESKFKYPVDIKETDDALVLDIAIVGLDENDVNIEVDGDTLRVSYTKEDVEEEKHERYVHQGIAKRSFNFGWRISPKFDLDNIEAHADKGLLTIRIPVGQAHKPKRIPITSGEPKKRLAASKKKEKELAEQN